MTTPTVSDLIEAFQRLPAGPRADVFHHLETILRLADCGTSEAAAFLVTIAADVRRQDLVRLEALKALAVWDEPDAATITRVQNLLLTLMTDENRSVRNYAVNACRWQFRNETLVAAIIERLLDPNESPLVRATALQVAERVGSTPPVRAAFGELAGRSDEPELAGEAARILKLWESEDHDQ